MQRLFQSKIRRLIVATAVGFAWLFFMSDSAWAQGCVVARQSSSPVLPETVNISGTANFNAAGESWLSPRRWELTVDYRYLHSHRHFVGTEEQKQRELQHTEVNNIIHIVDVAATYEFTPRTSLTVDVPLFFAHRFSENTPDQVTHGNGIGDVSLVGRVWLLRPPAENRGNVSFGLGVKFPTGKPDVVDTVNTPSGPATRVVDQSIQPGDGGYGIVAEFQGYQGFKRVTFYASGTYLANPRDTNGVKTGRGRPTEAIMSVSDQYLYRAGVVLPFFSKFHNLSWSVGVRGEGVPSRDLIGDSNGFRRPGYAIALDPGITITRSKDQWSFNVPVAVRRNRTRSVPDIIDNRHGDAAFADYLFLVGYSHHF
jgi:hypothetical protein